MHCESHERLGPSHIPEAVWQNFHKTVWKIFGWSEIPTRPSTENLVQVCITLPFLGSSGTSLLVHCGDSLASITPSSVVAGGLVQHSFSRLGVTEFGAQSLGHPPSVPVLVPFSIWIDSTLASFRGAATYFKASLKQFRLANGEV